MGTDGAAPDHWGLDRPGPDRPGPDRPGPDRSGLDRLVVECVVFDLDGTLTEVGTSGSVPGVAEILAHLAEAGVELAVATSAPTPVALRALAELDLAGWFASVAGSAPNAGTTGKDAVVAEALLGLGRPLPGGAHRAAVVGDGGGDMAAAVRYGMLAVGVAWGRGSAADLRGTGAAVVLDAPAQLLDVVRGDPPRRVRLPGP